MNDLTEWANKAGVSLEDIQGLSEVLKKHNII